MNQQDIIMFQTLVRTKNLFHASKLLFLNQSTISHKLMALESELGFSLFYRQRGKRSVELTPEGEQFLAIADKWGALYDEANAIRFSHLPQKLIIGCSDSLNSVAFTSLYRTVYKSKPSFTMSIKTQHSHEIYSNLEEDLLDIGFVYKNFARKSIQATPMFHEPMFFITAKSNISECAKEISVSDLDPNKEIYTSWSAEFESWHNAYFPNTSPAITVDKFSLHQFFLLENDVWSIVPSSYLYYLDNISAYHIIRVKENPPSRTCYFLVKNPLRKSKEYIINEFLGYFYDFLKKADFLNLAQFQNEFVRE